ncbi:MAG: spermidine synthase [Actinomycetota bacterium]|nr:spermidine synthase [Actinomycetota bacterium]
MPETSGRGYALADARLRLAILSFLILFLELALIRWTGSNIVYLSYFSNFVLLGSFLGIGLGFLRSNDRRELLPFAPVVLAALVAAILVFPVQVDRSGTDLLYFGGENEGAVPIWVMLPAIFLAVSSLMAMLADGASRAFASLPNLDAYRIDIIGSLAGVAAFGTLSLLHAPPVVWGVVVGAGLFLVLRPAPLIQPVLLYTVVLMLLLESLIPALSWSSYYKVSLAQGEGANIEVSVNGIPHQRIQSIEARRQQEPIYFLPYERLVAPPRKVLIIGAGTGTDVAIALAHGALKVDAVEIDRRLFEIGEELHPDRPYADPRVDVHIQDGRAFLTQSTERYDLILFSLPDSLLLIQGQSALRLESYLFTREAMRAARSHLQPDGAFGMYNYYREDWLIDRLAVTLSEVFGHPPCVDAVGDENKLALLMATEGAALRCPATWVPVTRPVPVPVSDDRPFVYLREAGVPSDHLLALALILIASFAAVRSQGGSASHVLEYRDLFFMGAAFLLLETKSVVQFALLFGTTWFVNTIVFAGVLLSILVAIEVSRRATGETKRWLYPALFLSLLATAVVPPDVLLDMPVVLRAVAAVAVNFAPITLANLIFADRFKRAFSPTAAFGANLVGAMVGGVLEYSALAVGYRWLVLLVAVLYLATIPIPSRRKVAPAPA